MGAVAQRIRRLREARGLSQEQLGRLVGVSRRVIWTWEADRSDVSAEEIPAIAAALDVPVDDLYSGAEPARLPSIALAEKLSQLLNTPPERIEIHVYVRREPGSELREFQPTRADEDLRDVLQVWDALDDDQRRVWLQAARELRDQGGE